MSVNVYDLANELERGIRQLDEFKAALAAKDKIATDAEAQEIWNEFTAMQAKIQMMMQTGQMPTQDDQEKMADLTKRIEGNATLKAYFDEQQRLSVYIQDIEKIVFGPLQDLAN